MQYFCERQILSRTELKLQPAIGDFNKSKCITPIADQYCSIFGGMKIL